MYFNKDTISMYYEKYGNGKDSIVILPGWGETRKTFTYLINHLKKDYTIYIVDYPGFGNSIFPNKDLTIYDYTNIIRDFLDNINVDNPIIIAHSFGGRIASILGGYYKDRIKKLVLIDVAGIKHKRNIFKLIKLWTYKLLKKLNIFLPKRKRSLYLKRLFKIFSSTDYKNLDSNMHVTFKNIVNEDLRYYFNYIDVDTLIIWGKSDKATPLKDGKIINKKISKSMLIIIPDAGHFPYLNYPSIVNKIISEFLKDD